MNMSVREHIALLLQDDRRRMWAVGIISVLAFAVIINVGLMLRRRGLAATQEIRVLDCPFTGDAAHQHNEDCFDEDGNLVCPLPEREAHVHDDACYVEDQILICGQEESDEHTHTDACYETERILVCSKEELVETHIHGEGCFKTVVVPVDGDVATDAVELQATAEDTDDAVLAPETEEAVPTPDEAAPDVSTDEPVDEATPESEDAADEEAPKQPDPRNLIMAEDDESSSAEGDTASDETLPAQSFDGELRDENDNVVLKVHVDAPAGALPEGVTMVVTPVTQDDIDGAIENAVAQKTSSRVTEVQSVDISFFDAHGNEVEPAKQLMVSFSSQLIAQNDGLLVVHVDNAGSGEVIDALSETELAARDRVNSPDTVSFDTKE